MSQPRPLPQPDPAASERRDSTEQAFLLRLGELLHAHGTPAHRLERLLTSMAQVIGIRAAFLSTPTSLIGSFGEGRDEQTRLLRIEPGDVDLGKLVEFDELLEDLEAGRADVTTAARRLEEVGSAPPRYGTVLVTLAFGIASGGAARFFGGGAAEIGASFVAGVGIFLLGQLLRRFPTSDGLFVPLAAFLVALGTQLAGRAGLALDDRIVTLAGLIVLIPGLTFTVGMIELATRHLVSGMARLASAGITFMEILLGVALAWKLGEGFALPRPESVAALPDWTIWVALALSPAAFAVLFQVRRSEWWVVFLVGVVGFLGSRLGAHTLGSQLGPFLGALAVGLCSNLYARAKDRPASVPLLPSILLLVPGAIGYRSLTAFLGGEALVGVEQAFAMGLVAASLVGGLLVANALLPPRRTL